MKVEKDKEEDTEEGMQKEVTEEDREEDTEEAMQKEVTEGDRRRSKCDTCAVGQRDDARRWDIATNNSRRHERRGEGHPRPASCGFCSSSGSSMKTAGGTKAPGPVRKKTLSAGG